MKTTQIYIPTPPLGASLVGARPAMKTTPINVPNPPPRAVREPPTTPLTLTTTFPLTLSLSKGRAGGSAPRHSRNPLRHSRNPLRHSHNPPPSFPQPPPSFPRRRESTFPLLPRPFPSFRRKPESSPSPAHPDQYLPAHPELVEGSSENKRPPSFPQPPPSFPRRRESTFPLSFRERVGVRAFRVERMTHPALTQNSPAGQ